jgi:8-amino-7-oxononanoate synthase
MMSDFESEMSAELDALAAQGLARRLRRMDCPQSPHLRFEGRDLLNFSSNDYLGLANHPLIKEAAVKAAQEYGAGSGASRLICGSLAPHHELEERLAAFKDTQAALSFSTGYAAALGTIGALVSRQDLVILDRLVHACLVDATRLSGAKIRVFTHNDWDDLENILRWATTGRSQAAALTPFRRILIVTESVFSMDGDQAPLREIAGLKDKYGAWLMVDEAHATGLFGPNRRGLAEALGISDRIEIQMGTLGKALGAAGGYICGSRKLIDLLVNSARSFIFSTAPVPAAAAAASAAVCLVQQRAGAELCDLLWKRVGQLLTGLARFDAPGENEDGLRRALRRVVSGMAGKGSSLPCSSAIVPLVIGPEDKTVQVADRLRQHGVYVPAIRYPTVARGEARLRLTVTAAHTPAEVEELLEALRRSAGQVT